MPNLFISSVSRGVVACVCLFFISVSNSSYAQQQEYLPFHLNDTLQLHRMAHLQRTSIQKHFTIPEKASAGYRKDFETIINRSSENAFRMVREGAFPDPIIEPYIQSVFQNIISANQELSGARLVLSRSPVENAYALADGTVFFNIGLLTSLENESQIAYILCHELAHIRLNHMEMSVREHLDALHSKDFKKQHGQAAKSKYNRNAKLGEVLEGISLANLFHKRSQERQADSLGYF
jgi:predicted Zn-dependent protease